MVRTQVTGDDAGRILHVYSGDRVVVEESFRGTKAAAEERVLALAVTYVRTSCVHRLCSRGVKQRGPAPFEDRVVPCARADGHYGGCVPVGVQLAAPLAPCPACGLIVGPAQLEAEAVAS